MFGDPILNENNWEKRLLNKHADVIVGYPFPSDGYTNNGIKIVGGYNLMQGYVQWDISKYWPNADGYKQYMVKDEDIIIAMDRPWVGNGFKIAMIRKKDLPAILIQRTACVRVHDINPYFLYALLDSVWFVDHCKITGTLVPHISIKDIMNYELIIPSIDLQNQFAMLFQQVNKSKVVSIHCLKWL